MTSDRIARLVDELGEEGKTSLLRRFGLYCLDGDNRRAGLSVADVELLTAIVDDEPEPAA